MKILNRLKNYLDNKWKNKKKTKEDGIDKETWNKS